VTAKQWMLSQAIGGGGEGGVQVVAVGREEGQRQCEASDNAAEKKTKQKKPPNTV